MNTVLKAILVVIGVILIPFIPLIGIPFLLVVTLKLFFKVLKFAVLVAVYFVILCLLIGLFVG